MTSEIPQRIDKYDVLANLGRGAKSTIWKVRDPGTDTIYTLKRVIRETKDDDRFLQQMKTEHTVCSRVDHDYLRKSFDLKRIPRWLKTQELLLILEYVEGQTLKQNPPDDFQAVIDVFEKVASGLDALHRSGYLHADIKPKNVLVTENDGVKIIDFGQSCPIGHRKTRIQGTPDYMAPEQVNRRMLDQRTDVFNLGATMYWVLTGQTFPTTMPRKELGEIAVSGPRDAPRPDEINDRVPSALSKLVMDCCAHEVGDRPENMGEVIARLDVVRHLLLRQKHPERFASQNAHDETDEFTAVSPDDSDDFDRFIDGIL